MTIRTNPELAAILDAATISNAAWSAAYKAALGANRRVICKAAPAGTAQVDVYATGATFRDAALKGDMVIEGGLVRRYGYTSGLTVCTAVDLRTHDAVLRIEGSGHWIEGSLGLPNSGCDFIVPANPTSDNSIAVTPNLRVKPPPFLRSGIGYEPPALDANAPTYIVIENWSDPETITEAGRIPLNNRLENWAFTNAEVADGMGDVRVTNSTQIVTFGDIEFGAVMFSRNRLGNSNENESHHQVLIVMKPTEENWPGYPRLSGYRTDKRTFDVEVTYGVSNTFPNAFKAKLYRADNTLLHTWDMPRDGLPINSPELSEFPTKTKPHRPHLNCGQMLFWESHKPKMSRFSKKWFPGMDMRAVRPSMGKEKAAYVGVAPMYWNTGGTNGVQHWFASGKWPNAMSMEAVNADLNLDPYLYEINRTGVTDNAYKTPAWASVHGTPASDMGELPMGAARTMGWGYEPGSWSMHDQLTGPGGVRIDRGFMPGPTMIHLTDPNWIHLRDNTPISEMIEHWNKAYFNHACHYLTDVRSLSTLPLDELFAGAFSLSKTYYGPNNSYTSGGTDYAVPQFCWVVGKVGTQNARPHGGAFTDANYRMPWNGYAPDGLHNYQTPGYVAIHYNSPAHAYSAKHRYITHLMIGLAGVKPTSSAQDYFGSRQHAWMLLQHSVMWKLGSDHPVLGVRQADIEQYVVTELTQIYNEFYIPIWVQNSQDTRMQALKRFGTPIHWSATSGKWTAESFGLTFYMANVLQQMRQFGLFKKLWNMGEVPQKALLTIIRLLDAGSIQWFTQTRGSYMGSTLPGARGVFGGPPYIPIDHETEFNPELPTSWGDWRDRKWPLQGKEDWVHKPDGSWSAPDSSEQLRASWPAIRLNYFRDIECLYDWAEVQQAADIVADFHNQRAKRIDDALNVEKVGINGLRLKEWGIPTPYAHLQAPNPTDVETL